jgi:formylglycine-generating enzyme required for sulfatase activity
MKKSILILALAALIVTACNAGSVFGDLSPTQVPGNTAWTPVVQTYGGVQMVKVPPGCFIMGHTEGRRDEQPETKICFDKAFWIDRYEVTNGQYGSDGAFPGDDVPHDNLTWLEARDFCASRGARLPTEAEWEYAARRMSNGSIASGRKASGYYGAFEATLATQHAAEWQPYC